jgi:hypothetical protein
MLLQSPLRSLCRQKGGGSMNNDALKREAKYESRMAVARTMLKNGIITKEEYCRIDTIFLEKYRPLLGELRAGKSPN